MAVNLKNVNPNSDPIVIGVLWLSLMVVLLVLLLQLGNRSLLDVWTVAHSPVPYIDTPLVDVVMFNLRFRW